MKRLILTVCLLLVATFTAFAQKETNWWFFGKGNSLNFNNTTTVNDDNGTPTAGMPEAGVGEIKTDEGCFTLSDNDGNLMMYSDGMTIWDKNGSMLPDGYGLLGGSSSTQSGIIVPYPGSSTKYYAISVAQERAVSAGITYSVVDMALNGGLGDVVSGQKNQVLRAGPTDENIAAVKKENSNNYWIIHRNITETNCTFYVWELTSTGPTAPVTYTLNLVSPLVATHLGYLKFTIDGTRFACPVFMDGNMLSGEFDPATGQVSNLQCRNIGFDNSIYSFEFSSSGDHLYVTASTKKLGYISWDDLRNTTTSAIDLNKAVSNVQMNADGRIYGTGMSIPHLFVIMDPENGAGADIRTFTSYLRTNASHGLPTFSASWWNLEVGIETDLELPVCKGTEIEFTATLASSDLAQVKSVKWNFGDGTVVEDTSISATMTRKYTYKKPGTYTLTLTPYKDDGTMITGSIKTLEVPISPCVIPVNPNIHMSNY